MESKIERLRNDLSELEKLHNSATRKGVQDILSIQVSKLKTQILNIETEIVPTKTTENESNKAAIKTYCAVIRNYSWDESEKFMKIYVSLKNVQSLDKEKVSCTFTDRGFTLIVSGLDNKDHQLTIAKLAGEVKVDSSYSKIKTDMVAVMIAKKNPGKWEGVTEEEKKVKDAKKSKLAASESDPSGGLMNMMKQMYDEGDDNMKRMLNKSWYESQQKSGGGMPGMGGMGGMPDMGGMGGMPGMGGLGDLGNMDDLKI